MATPAASTAAPRPALGSSRESGKVGTLRRRIVDLCRPLERGRLLDLGCGDGTYANALQRLGFHVVGADIRMEEFRYQQSVPFAVCDLSKPLPLATDSFQITLFLEVIEHIYNPAAVISEIGRVLTPGGLLLISTPNVLNLSSRLRFLVEGSFEFFREPTLDYARYRGDPVNNHVIPWRYHELEFLLDQHGFDIAAIETDSHHAKSRWLAPLLLPPLWAQRALKEWRKDRKDGVDYRRIHRILLSPPLLYGRHLILVARKRPR